MTERTTRIADGERTQDFTRLPLQPPLTGAGHD